MNNEPDKSFEARIIALEERIAWYETEREALDEVVQDLYDRVATLTRRLASMTANHAEPEAS